MAIDMFLNLYGIEGEAKDASHANEIDVLAWSWGVFQGGTTHLDKGGASNKPEVQGLSFTHYVDAASPVLLQRAFDGKYVKEGTLVIRKVGGTPHVCLKISMTDIIVTSVSTSGAGGEDRLIENVELKFSKVKYSYIPQKEDGTSEASIDAGWDIAKNVTLV